MKIVVMGGTGLVGRKLVRILRNEGHEAIAASRSTGVNLVTGEGLHEVLLGAETVVDVCNLSYGDADDLNAFFELAGSNLFEAELRSGVSHHVTLSAVGTDRLADRGNFRAKATQEALAAGAGVPHTIVRSTPFFEFLYGIVDEGGEGELIRLPPIRVRPIAADDVAEALARIALGRPAHGVIELAGPEVRLLAEIAEEILVANEDTRTLVVDVEARYFGARVGDEPLVGDGGHRFASTRFDDWLRSSLQPNFAEA